MEKLKIGTVFSGIGSPEKALEYLNIEHEIVFACDNGNIELECDKEEELSKIRKLSKEEKNEYVRNLYRKNTRKTNFVEKTYMENYDISQKDYHYDVQLLDGYDYRNKVDVFVGGSPCQAFSAIGNRGGLEDARGTLFYDYARLVQEVNPKVFVYENVFGMLTHDKGNTWKVIKHVFDNLGYDIYFEVLNAKDYNIPQSRRRLIVVGFKSGKYNKKFKFPNKKNLQFTMQDFLLDNCNEGNFTRKNGEIQFNYSDNKKNINEKLFLSEKLKAYVLSPGTKNFYHKNAEINLPIARALLASMGNSHRASVNNYVTTDDKIRALDPRETARLMGYADEFIIPVSRAQAYKQFGNSIVVDVMMAIMKEIMEVLNESS